MNMDQNNTMAAPELASTEVDSLDRSSFLIKGANEDSWHPLDV